MLNQPGPCAAPMQVEQAGDLEHPVGVPEVSCRVYQRRQAAVSYSLTKRTEDRPTPGPALNRLVDRAGSGAPHRPAGKLEDHRIDQPQRCTADEAGPPTAGK